jgi:hypothetical protein
LGLGQVEDRRKISDKLEAHPATLGVRAQSDFLC